MRIPGFADLSPWDVVKRAVKSFLDDDMVTYAAALSYHLMLALFPFVIFLLTLLGALGLSDFFDRLLRQAQAGAARRMVRTAGASHRRDSRAAPGRLAVRQHPLCAVGGIDGDALGDECAQRRVQVEETRPAWKRYPLSILYTIGLVAAVIATAAFRLIGPWAAQRFANQIGLTTAVATLWTWLHWPVVVLLLLLTIALSTTWVPISISHSAT